MPQLNQSNFINSKLFLKSVPLSKGLNQGMIGILGKEKSGRVKFPLGSCVGVDGEDNILFLTVIRAFSLSFASSSSSV